MAMLQKEKKLVEILKKKKRVRKNCDNLIAISPEVLKNCRIQSVPD